VLAVEARAPALRARRKARHSEGDEARAVARACWLWRGCRQPVPVVWGGRTLGVAVGDPDRGRTVWWAGQGFPWSDYDGVVNSLSAKGQHGSMYWMKPRSTSVVVDTWYDLWGAGGVPQAGDWSGTAKTARQFLNTTAGAPYVPGGAVSPTTKWLTRHGVLNSETTGGAMVLYDRVLSYDACTMSGSNQAMTNTLAATRYISTGDPGLQIFVEADTVHNATAANLTTLHYTNSAGTTGQNIPASLTKIVSIAAPTSTLGARHVFQAPSAAMSGDPFLVLASGDTGVRKLEDYTWSAAPTGTCSYVLMFPLALHPDVHGANSGSMSDAEFVSGLDNGNKRIYDDACLSWLIACRTTGAPGQMHGWAEFGWV
jgi:hypothetical protein